MKIYVNASQKWDRHKRKNIDKSEYQSAINAGAQVLAELHAKYPDVFPAKYISIRRSHAWSDNLYVELYTGVPVRRKSYEIGKDFNYAINISREIKQEIMPKLGISWDDFQISLSYNKDYTHYVVIVFDMNASAWE